MQRWPCMSCNSFVILRFSLLACLLELLLAGPSLQAAEPLTTGCSASAYRGFDFWLGQWNVHLGDGRKAGSNLIEATEDGCLIHESWVGVMGNRGSSMNFYEPERQRWRQIWVSGGSIIEIAGNLVDGEMVLAGEIHDRASGASHPFRGRWTLLADGRVRQFFEEHQENKWQPWFEGFYSKVVE